MTSVLVTWQVTQCSSGGVCWKMVNTIYYHQEKKNKMRFQEVKFLEAAEFQFCTHMTAVVAIVLWVIQNRTCTKYMLDYVI